jgi:succinate dehydrogenase / fumarate reductase, membrane anchor subunit
MVNRVVVGAHYGLKDWLAQRVTAGVMVFYTLTMAVLVPLSGGSYEGWHALMGHQFIRFISFIFILSLCYHAWVGIRDIWMDYVNPTGLRLALHVLTLLVLVGCAGWAIQILWRL